MRVELRPDLDEVAARMAAPTVERLVAELAREARERAPGIKVWVTSEDERVRPSHAQANDQEIPENLRFRLKKQIYVRGGGRGSRKPGRTALAPQGYDLAREPRDENLPADQRQNCRCISVDLPGVIARRIVTGPVVVEGARAHGRVSVQFNRIVESERGTSGDRPARFMGSALDAVAARLRRRR